MTQDTYVYFNGSIMRYDAIGNIVYGYLGKVFGISDSVLFAGRSYAQIKDGTYKNDWIPITGGDDPLDQYYIQYGIDLYNKK
ncbi:polymorphic toxin type 44 domain-containing protein [Paenibacillus abyssi]|uniref:polymorphic toxin type 44 domain-containing protein n=1 Tax=Paenibacillus abyssi TaxID=1340531 RepID=UPI0035713A6D